MVPIEFSDFVTRVRRDMQSGGNWIYRGQRDRNWPLETSFQRFCRANGEEYSLELFERLLHDFLRESSDLTGNDFFSLSIPQQIALSQHHGLPTPFLDWTSSPYIASFFAVTDLVEQAKSDGTLQNLDRGEFRIWALDVSNVAPHDGFGEEALLGDNATTFAFLTPAVFQSKRISRQLGCFTYMNIEGGLDEDRNNGLRDEFNFALKDYFVRGNISNIIRELRLMGITGGGLFDEMDYVSKDILMRRIR